MGVHSRRDARYRCHRCHTTYGTPLYRLKTDPNIVQLVLTLLTFGCPIPALVMAFKIDERTLADWVRQPVNTLRVFTSTSSVRARCISGRCRRTNAGVGPNGS
ncbi:hypothetical protein ACXXCZ_17550 (plasmid) [Deinococcus sp. PEB2-67]